MTETHWKPIEHAPKDGKPLLLWTRLKTYSRDGMVFHRVVGFWQHQLKQWKVEPEQLNGEEELIPTHWADLPAPPSTQEAGQ
jgi:Protein of unknown function (DUF551)